MTEAWQWIQSNDTLLWWLGAGSVVMFAGTLLALPVVIVRMPVDYFAGSRAPKGVFQDRHPVIRGIWLALRNLVGVVLVVAGIAMLVLPGQGLLTIFIGVTLLTFPGKRELERRVVSRKPILRSLNWIRRRAGRSPLIVGIGGPGDTAAP